MRASFCYEIFFFFLRFLLHVQEINTFSLVLLLLTIKKKKKNFH